MSRLQHVAGTHLGVEWSHHRETPVGERAMKAKLLDVLLLTCIAAFVTGIAIAAVNLLG